MPDLPISRLAWRARDLVLCQGLSCTMGLRRAGGPDSCGDAPIANKVRGGGCLTYLFLGWPGEQRLASSHEQHALHFVAGPSTLHS